MPVDSASRHFKERLRWMNRLDRADSLIYFSTLHAGGFLSLFKLCTWYKMLKQLFFVYSLSDSILSSHHPLSTISFSVLWKNKVAFELMLFCQSSGNTVAISFHWSKTGHSWSCRSRANRAHSFFNLAGLLTECIPCTNMVSKTRYNRGNVWKWGEDNQQLSGDQLHRKSYFE